MQKPGGQGFQILQKGHVSLSAWCSGIQVSGTWEPNFDNASPFSRAAFDEAGRRTSGGLLQEPTLASFFHFTLAVIVQSRSLNNKLTWFKLLDLLELPLLFLDLAQNDRQSVLSNGHVEHEYSTSTLLEIARISVPFHLSTSPTSQDYQDSDGSGTPSIFKISPSLSPTTLISAQKLNSIIAHIDALDLNNEESTQLWMHIMVKQQKAK